MDKETILKIVNDIGLKKSDCDRLIGLIELFQANTNGYEVKIPLSILSVSGYSYKDIKLLKEVFYNLNGKQTPFTVKNEYYFEPNIYNRRPLESFYSSVDENDSFGINISNASFYPSKKINNKEEQENIFINITFGFYPNDFAKEKLIELRNELPNETETIMLVLDTEGLKRLRNKEELIYPIDIDSDRYTVLVSAINGPTRPSHIKIKGKKNLPTIKADLNKTAKERLKLTDFYGHEDLIVNRGGNGYEIDKKYKIKMYP